MRSDTPRFESYEVVNAHTGEVHSSHTTRRKAQSAKDAAGDHALRVRGGEPRRLSLWERVAAIITGRQNGVQ